MKFHLYFIVRKVSFSSRQVVSGRRIWSCYNHKRGFPLFLLFFFRVTRKSFRFFSLFYAEARAIKTIYIPTHTHPTAITLSFLPSVIRKGTKLRQTFSLLDASGRTAKNINSAKGPFHSS